MDLNEYKPERQREILAALGRKFIAMAQGADDLDVEETLEHIQDGYLDVLEQHDFFGTEGWRHWLGLD